MTGSPVMGGCRVIEVNSLRVGQSVGSLDQLVLENKDFRASDRLPKMHHGCHVNGRQTIKHNFAFLIDHWTTVEDAQEVETHVSEFESVCCSIVVRACIPQEDWRSRRAGETRHIDHKLRAFFKLACDWCCCNSASNNRQIAGRIKNTARASHHLNIFYRVEFCPILSRRNLRLPKGDEEGRMTLIAYPLKTSTDWESAKINIWIRMVNDTALICINTSKIHLCDLSIRLVTSCQMKSHPNFIASRHDVLISYHHRNFGITMRKCVNKSGSRTEQFTASECFQPVCSIKEAISCAEPMGRLRKFDSCHLDYPLRNLRFSYKPPPQSLPYSLPTSKRCKWP